MPTAANPPRPDRLAGRLALLSGLCGIVAFACLMLFLVLRPSAADPLGAQLLLRIHDVGVILQSLSLMPLSLALDAIARRDPRGSSGATGIAAVACLALVIVLMVSSLAHVVADVLYMIPQGAVGAWLMVACRQVANGLPRGLRRLGLVAGAGLILVALFPIGYALMVDPAILRGPVGDDDPTPPGTDRANQVVHIILGIGTLVGCSTYPVWSALAGRWLLLRGGR